MSEICNRKVMLKKDLIEENIRLKNEIIKLKDYHFIYQQSVNMHLSAKGSEMALDRVKINSENANLRSESEKLKTEFSQKTATETSMKVELKCIKTTGNKLATIILDQIPGTLTNSIFSDISREELAPFGVFSRLTPAQTLNEEIRSGLTVIRYKRNQDIFPNSVDGETEPEEMETVDSSNPSQFEIPITQQSEPKLVKKLVGEK